MFLIESPEKSRENVIQLYYLNNLQVGIFCQMCEEREAWISELNWKNQKM